MNYKIEMEFVIEEIKKYFEDSTSKKAILGISGGKDSTVCAMLLGFAIGFENVIGVMMPNGEQTDIDDSIFVCDCLGLDSRYVNIEDTYNSIIASISDGLTVPALYNIPPRIRMIVLRAIGQTYGARLVGTGNLSEYCIGWCTLDGDMAHDNLMPLINYTSTEVREIGLCLVEKFFENDKHKYEFTRGATVKTVMTDLVWKTPSDGLTGRSDEENFGFTYKDLDAYIKEYTCGNEEIDDIIADRIKKSEFKRVRRWVPEFSQEELDELMEE